MCEEGAVGVLQLRAEKFGGRACFSEGKIEMGVTRGEERQKRKSWRTAAGLEPCTPGQCSTIYAKLGTTTAWRIGEQIGAENET